MRKPKRLTRWIEFHDSTVLSLRRAGTDVEIVLDAYVHRWEKRRDAWSGTGWSQAVQIVVKNVLNQAIAPETPVSISDGVLRTGEVRHDNLIELPLSSTEPTSLGLVLTDAHVLEIVGGGLLVEAAGEARYIEDLPADLRPNDID